MDDLRLGPDVGPMSRRACRLISKEVRLRAHQQEIADLVLADLRAGIVEVVVGACPGFGKTELAIYLIQTLIALGLVKRVLVLAHGTLILRQQFEDRIRLRAPELLETGAVEVRIPHESAKIQGEFDLVVVDEGHDFYNVVGGRDEQIIARVGAKQRLVLTGTPAPFIRKGAKVHIYPLFDLIRGGFASEMKLILTESAYSIHENDWNRHGEVRSEVVYLEKSTEKTVSHLFRVLPADVWRGKTIIVCRNVRMAKQVARALERRKIEPLISYSKRSKIDKGDKNSEQVEAFRKGACPVLVVVRRARLGFDMPTLRNLVDLTGSRNPDVIFQMICRLVRLPEDGSRPMKRFVKLMPKAFSGIEFEYFMTGVRALGEREFYSTWDGGSLWRLKVPGASTGTGIPKGVGASSRPKPYLREFLFWGNGFDARGGLKSMRLGDLLGHWEIDPGGKKESILAFIAQHGRRPGLGSQADPHEKKLASRLKQYTLPASNSYDPLFLAEVERMAPSTGVPGPDERREAILQFVRRTGRRPSAAARHPEERSMGARMHHYACLDRQFRAALERLSPSRSARAQLRKSSVLEFVRTHGRRPLKSSPVGRERELARAMQVYVSPSSGAYDPRLRLTLDSLVPRPMPRHRVLVACAVCRRTFRCRYTKLTCSRKCFRRHAAEVQARRKKVLSHPCPACGKYFDWTAKRPRKTCSRSCGRVMAAKRRSMA